MKKQNRFKSTVLWTSLIAAAVLVGQAFGLLTIDKADALTNAGNAVLVFLVGAGILNNPTNPDGL